MRRFRITAFVALVLLSTAGGAGAASLDDERDDAPAGVPAPGADRRALESADEKLRRLEQRHERLDAMKRSRRPYSSERKLRHRLRRNEADQRRYKQERDRIEHELRSGSRPGQ